MAFHSRGFHVKFEKSFRSAIEKYCEKLKFLTFRYTHAGDKISFSENFVYVVNG